MRIIKVNGIEKKVWLEYDRVGKGYVSPFWASLSEDPVEDLSTRIVGFVTHLCFESEQLIITWPDGIRPLEIDSVTCAPYRCVGPQFDGKVVCSSGKKISVKIVCSIMDDATIEKVNKERAFEQNERLIAAQLERKAQHAQDPEYFTTQKSAAEAIGVTPKTIGNWLKRGWIVPEIINGQKIIKMTDLEVCSKKLRVSSK